MYKMIIFVNRGTEPHPIWEVYGLVQEFVNDNLGTFDTEIEAMQKAHSYCLPVMRGFSNTYEVVSALRKLTKQTTDRS